MRQKDKLERWIEKYLKSKCVGIAENTRSRYYRFNNRILRTSDHVAFNSDGDLSIVHDAHDKNRYIAHAVKTGEISILTYEEAKQLVRAMGLLPAIAYMANGKKSASIKGATIEDIDALEKVINATDKGYILGVPATAFTPGRLFVIKTAVKKQLKELKKRNRSFPSLP